MHFSPKRRAFEKGRLPPRVHGKRPPWQASKGRIKALQTVMQGLKVPKGWPPVPLSLESMSTMKLEQALAFAGDTGRYLLDLLDIDPVMQTHMQAYLLVLRDCQQKTPIIPLPDIKRRLHEAAAALEALLPAFWNSITKHFATHLDLFQVNWGCFWAANELIHERIMAKLKRLSKHGNRNRMATLANNFDIFQTANWWLLQRDMKLHYKVCGSNDTMTSINRCCQVPPSSVAAEAPMFRWRGKAVIGATTTHRVLTRPEFVQVQQAWAVRDSDFDVLLDAYKKNVKKLRVKPSLKHWKAPAAVSNLWGASVRERMRLMQGMSRKCKVFSLACSLMSDLL